MIEEPPHPFVRKRQRQREEARALANAKRTAMGRLKRDMKSGAVDGLQLLLGYLPELEEPLGSLTLAQFLMAQPRFGVLARDEFLEEMELSGTVRMQHLTMNQRTDLARLIRMTRKGKA